MTGHSKMDPEVLSMVLDTIGKLEKERITLPVRLKMDEKGDFPLDLIRFMLSPEIALHLIFIPEQYGGLGAGAAQAVVVVCFLAQHHGGGVFRHKAQRIAAPVLVGWDVLGEGVPQRIDSA